MSMVIKKPLGGAENRFLREQQASGNLFEET